MAITSEQRLRAINLHKKSQNILAEGVRMVTEAHAEPAATVGVLVDGFAAWEPDKQYGRFYQTGFYVLQRVPTL